MWRMASTTNIGLLGFIAWVVFVQLRYRYRWRALQKWGKQHNCEELFAAPNKVFWGMERYAALLYSLITGSFTAVDFLEDFILGKYKALGVNTFRMWNIFNTTQVETAEPANVQALLATQFDDFDLGPIRHANLADLLGRGIFTAERDTWQRFRQQLRPQFSRAQISDIDSFEHHVQILFRALPETDADGWIGEVDIMPYLYRYMSDTSTEFAFGQSVNSQSKYIHAGDSGNTTETKEDLDFVESTDFAQRYIVWRVRFGALYWLANSKVFQKACQTVKSYADGFVSRALSPDHKLLTKSNGLEKYVFLEELIKETRDPIELRDQVLQLLFAGRDTTSAALSWVILLLARHPAQFASLRETIISTFGTESSPLSPITFESLKGCKAITHVLYETQRLYPIVPINSRKARCDTTLPIGGGPDGKSPIVIKKGEHVGFSAYVIHRREDIWGRDATEWKPERWVGRKLGWEFVGFGGGPRVCIGQQYALTEAAFVIVKLLQRFDRIEAIDMTGTLPKGVSITLKPGAGVRVKLHRASE